MSELVTISIEDHIADVRLNRPEKMNALSFDMMAAIANALETLSGNNSIRVVVLSGEGRAFCAGLDIGNIAEMGSGENKEASNESPLTDLRRRYKDQITNLPQHIAFGWQQLPVPVIAAIHGVAFGGGCQIALGADIRFATPDARLSIMEMKWGLIPDMSGSQTIRDIVPLDVAKELIFTGKIVNGNEAAQLQLVTHVCDDPLADAMELAKEIASKNPHAIRAAKQLLNTTRHGDQAKGMMLESELEMTLVRKPNQMEAVIANLENRAPNFKDPE